MRDWAMKIIRVMRVSQARHLGVMLGLYLLASTTVVMQIDDYRGENPMLKKLLLPLVAAEMVLSLASCGGGSTSVAALTPASAAPAPQSAPLSAQDALATQTPIKHLVVIYGENISFDHYFGTYPTATNPAGEPKFTALANTPSVNGLSQALLTANPNSTNAANGAGAANPFRLDRSQAGTSDQNHNYTPEQQAVDNGAMDLFPKYTGTAGNGGSGAFNTKGLVMGYFDGNTVTALWNYAQHFAISDNAFADQYGPSTPGALNLVSGQTNGMVIGANTANSTSFFVSDTQGGYTLVNDADPTGDACASTSKNVHMTGKNIGDLLNAKGITWGWFEGGFNLQTVNANGSTGCSRNTTSPILNASTNDYIPHHQPFQYYASTANPNHLRPSSTAAIGSSVVTGGKSADPANHQYDLDDFFTALSAGNFPSISFLKASGYQDGHAGYSDPLDEQANIVKIVNFVQSQPDWSNTAIIIAYDDSDGWYDHLMTAITNGSFDATSDQVTAPGACGVAGTTKVQGGVAGTGPVNGRCGPGMRQPFVLISPLAKGNYVDHTLVTQASVVRFIEDNWLAGERLGGGSFDATTGVINGMFNFQGPPLPRLYLLETTGEP
jgi:phospholipase C